MRGLGGLLWVAAGLGGVSCSTTDYDLYSQLPELPSLEGGASSDGSGGSSISSGGTGATFAESSECGDVAAGEPLPVRIYSVERGLCLSKGNAQVLMGNQGFLVDLVSCDTAPERLWTVTQDEAQTLEFESYSSGFNLDVRFADSAAGTPFVLYGAHGLYNQRFFSLAVSDTQVQLSPRHAKGMCAEAQASGVELQPCDELESAQYFQLIDCDTPL